MKDSEGFRQVKTWRLDRKCRNLSRRTTAGRLSSPRPKIVFLQEIGLITVAGSFFLQESGFITVANLEAFEEWFYSE